MTRFGLLILLSAALMLLVFSSGYARTWHIEVNGTGDAPTIQAAIDSAGMDDTLLVGPGTYSWFNQGTGNDFGMIRIMQGSPALTILSKWGPEMTILDGQFQGRIFFYQGHYPGTPGGLTIDGFTFVNGRATQVGNLVGGAFTAHLSSPIIRNSVFKLNSADQGGAYWYGGVGSPQLIDCQFERNSARWGGAIFIVNTPNTALVSNCVIHANSASEHGGAIFGYNAPLFVEHCVITGNTASTNGGGMALQNCWPSNVTHSTFYQNWGSGGGGIALIADTDLSVDHTIIAASANGGAAALNEGTTMTFSCSDLYGNMGGDWTGPIAGQNGVDGNFSDDPLFCDASNSDFSLEAGSPCAPDNQPGGTACDAIGALPVGCGDVPVERRTWGAIKSMFGDSP